MKGLITNRSLVLIKADKEGGGIFVLDKSTCMEESQQLSDVSTYQEFPREPRNKVFSVISFISHDHFKNPLIPSVVPVLGFMFYLMFITCVLYLDLFIRLSILPSLSFQNVWFPCISPFWTTIRLVLNLLWFFEETA